MAKAALGLLALALTAGCLLLWLGERRSTPSPQTLAPEPAPSASAPGRLADSEVPDVARASAETEQAPSSPSSSNSLAPRSVERSLRFRVLSLGRAVADARISLSGVSAECRTQASTAGDGTCTIVWPCTTDDTRVEARAGDELESGSLLLSDIIGERDDEISIVLYERVVLNGRVEDSRANPLPFAAVGIGGGVARSGLVMAPRPSAAAADERGEFQLTLLANGAPYIVTANFAGRSSEPVRVFAEALPAEVVVLRISRSEFEILGVVLDPDGVPVGNAALHVCRIEGNEGARESSSNPDGTYSIALSQAGEFVLRAQKEGWAPSHPVRVRVAEEAPAAFVRLQLTPSASLQGRVVWDDSRPAVGATVIVVSKSDRGTDAGAASKVCSYLSTTYPETITDNSGTFGVSGLFEGTRVDVVAAPEGACQGCSVIEEGVLAGTSDLTIVLSKQRVEGVTLRGRVTSRDAANPITTLLVTVVHRRASGRAWESSVIRTLNVPDGRFELEHLRLGDTYGFRFEAEGHAPVVVEAWEARPDAEEMHADLSQHGSAKVCLERESNDDIRQLGVTLVRIDALTALRPWRWSQLLAPRTDCAEFPILRDGRYRVMVGRPSDSAPLVDDEIEVALDAETSKTFVVPKPPR